MDPSLSNFTPMDLLNAADSSPYMSALVTFAPVLFGADAPDTICLLHSVESLALNYTVRSPPSQSVDPSAWSYVDSEGSIMSTFTEYYKFKFWRCYITHQLSLNIENLNSMSAYLKCMCNFVSVRSIENFGIWPYVSKQANKLTYIRVLQCSPTNVGLGQTRSNYDMYVHIFS